MAGFVLHCHSHIHTLTESDSAFPVSLTDASSELPSLSVSAFKIALPLSKGRKGALLALS